MPNTTSKKKTNFNKIISKYVKGYSEKRLLEDFYEIFVMIQKAVSNFDYETLEEYCSNKLYKEYKKSLESLQDHRCNNIIKSFKHIKSSVKNVAVVNNKLQADIYLEVSFYDYVEDEDKNTMYGKKDEKTTNSYNLEFILDIDDKKNTSFVLNNKQLLCN